MTPVVKSAFGEALRASLEPAFHSYYMEPYSMSDSTIREEVLEKAKEYVLEDRNTDYDTPERNFEMIANLWNAYLFSSEDNLSVEIPPHDVAILMILVKVARIATSPQKLDHWIDIAGYAACGAECTTDPEEEK